MEKSENRSEQPKEFLRRIPKTNHLGIWNALNDQAMILINPMIPRNPMNAETNFLVKLRFVYSNQTKNVNRGPSVHMVQFTARENVQK